MMDHRGLKSAESCLGKAELDLPCPLTTRVAALAGSTAAIRLLKMSSENSTLNYPAATFDGEYFSAWRSAAIISLTSPRNDVLFVQPSSLRALAASPSRMCTSLGRYSEGSTTTWSRQSSPASAN